MGEHTEGGGALRVGEHTEGGGAHWGWGEHTEGVGGAH